MHRYYIKKLGRQELGSPLLMPDGSVRYSRGRYIYISKDNDGFFPHLSTTLLNDNALILLKMPFAEEAMYAHFGYHNSSRIDTVDTVGKGRNEMRLYLNNQIDDNKAFFHPEEILVIERIDLEGSPVYSMNLFAPGNPVYDQLNSLIPARKGFTLYNEVLPFVRTPILSGSVADLSEPVRTLIQTEQNNTLNQGVDIDEMGASLFNSRTFHDFVMNAYHNLCAITHRAISYNGFSNLEAAHIMPRAHNGVYLPCNGIAMSKDMHFAFDKGFFTIDENYKILVHPDVERVGSYLNDYNKTSMYLPREPFFQPRQEFLEYHRTNIYGTFRQIRSISE